MRGQLYHRHTNTTALYSSLVVSALSSKLDNPGSSPGIVPLRRVGKKMQALLLDLAKSIYYLTSNFKLCLYPVLLV